MRILTYSNPFEINKNKKVWDIVTKHPHFCASDTLVQGLETEYGRNSFGILRTMNSLINKTFEKFTNNPQNDIQIFLTVSNILRKMSDADLKSAFRFNIADAVEAVKFLAVLKCDISKFDQAILSQEQKKILDIYAQVMQTPSMDILKSLSELTKEDFIYAARATINDEIEYLCNLNSDYVSKAGISLPIKGVKDGYDAVNKMITHLAKQMQEAPDDDFGVIYQNNDLDRLKHILTLIKDEDDNIYEKIVIHGVHKITPIMYLLFKLLESLEIEVIFLINYATNMPNIYKTWREVYDWCDIKFEYAEEIDITIGQKLGIALASVIEGKKLNFHPTEYVTIYNNLTTFTDREVKQCFERTFDKYKKTYSLNKMKTQYYAVNGESSNEILKMYFPEQFNQKPFLSYPIGQFILGIYQMWSFEDNTLKLSDKSLSECAVSNLFKAPSDINVFDILNKIKLYFSDVETIGDYYKRLEELETALQIITHNRRYFSLGKISFFGISFGELKIFEQFLQFIENIANQLFKDANESVDFGKHFKNLMEIISIPSLNNATLTKTEQALISEIDTKLSKCNDREVLGNIEDVKEALCFYLSGSKKGDTSNWIVRDFEQIDGAVLLRKTSKALNYHFALLSNAHMTNQSSDALPWPLTEDMFIGYVDASSAVPVVTKGLLERRNFLKFTIFYGTFFTKCNIKLSYIAEENGEEHTPYYLLNVLRLECKPYKEESNTSFKSEGNPQPALLAFNGQKIEENSKGLFSVCPYKYLQTEVLREPIEYYSEYHIKYFLANFMYSFIKGLYDLESPDISKNISVEFERIQSLFPFWNKVVFMDIEKNTRLQLNAYTNKLKGGYKLNPFQELQYEKRKENFLIAQWTDAVTGQKYMHFKKKDIDRLIESYMLSHQLYPYRNELPHRKVCENCNFGEVCLRNYYEASTDIEGGE